MSTVTVQLKFLKGTLYLLKNKFQFRLQWTLQIYKIGRKYTNKGKINYFYASKTYANKLPDISF